MILVDANILIYAVNRDADQHGKARNWLEQALSGTTEIGFAWIVILAFIRVTTRAGIMARPLHFTHALSYVDGWLSQSNAILVSPGERHWPIFRNLLSGTSGTQVTLHRMYIWPHWPLNTAPGYIRRIMTSAASPGLPISIRWRNGRIICLIRPCRPQRVIYE